MSFPSPPQGPDLDPMRASAEGIAGVAVCAEHVDGVVDLAEEDHLAHELGRMHLFRALLPGELDEIIATQHEAAATVPPREFLTLCAAHIPPRLRATAFFVAADLIMSDGEVTEGERTFLDDAREALDVDAQTAETILDALAIKYRD